MPNLAGFLTFVAYSAVSVLLPFFLEEELLYSPSQAGILMTAIPLTIFVIAPLSGRVSDRVGNAGLSVAGGMVGGLGLLFLSGTIGAGLGPLSTPLQIILGLCSIGLATGLFQSPNNSAIMSAVPVEKLGIASAFLATVRNLGLVLGTGLSTALFSWRLRSHGSLTSALHFTLSMAAGVAFMASFVSFARRKRQ
jgi:MFS family permease